MGGVGVFVCLFVQLPFALGIIAIIVFFVIVIVLCCCCCCFSRCFLSVVVLVLKASFLLQGAKCLDPLSYFSFHPVLQDWINKGRRVCYPVCRMVHIKEPLLPIGKSSPCRGSSGFPLSLSEWSFTICMTPYNRN